MRRYLVLSGVLAVLICLAVRAADAPATPENKSDQPDWALRATVIEACSCPMFCQCYFNAAPAGHAAHEGHDAEHYCKFNNAYKINKGSYKATKLDGDKLWIYSDLGGDLSKGQMD